MGLPSGLLWSPVDLDYTMAGKVADSPYSYVKSFFSWGNIEPHNPIRDRAAFDYNWGNINAQSPWYDGQVYGSTPGSSLEGYIPLSMDAANVMLGSLWRMPSLTEFRELIANCDFVQADGQTVIGEETTNKLVTVNGCRGIYLKSKTNGNLLFFSCSGYGERTTLYERSSRGYYFSLSYRSVPDAYGLVFSSSGVNPGADMRRFRGCAIRPVYDRSTL